MPRSYTIEIDCHNGDLEYSDPHLRLNHGDTIKWICKDLSSSFAVHIGWNSPFAKGRYRSGPGGSIEVTIPPNAQPGCYKYIAVVYDGRDIWTDDPEFIIRD